MLWYHVKHKLLLNKMQSCLWRYKLPWQQESIENTLYFGLTSGWYLRNEIGEPIFLLHKSDQQAKVNRGADSELP